MHRRLTACAAGIGLIALGAASAAAQANWPQFRGPAAGVAVDDPRLPDTWGPDENIVWELDIPGQSWSSPIVWDDHVFVVTAAAEGGDDNPLAPVETYRARSLGGSMSAADTMTSDVPLQWMLYDIDFGDG